MTSWRRSPTSSGRWSAPSAPSGCTRRRPASDWAAFCILAADNNRAREGDVTAREILFHQAARERIVRGMTVLVDAVKETLGPRARTVLLEQPFGPPIVINSGVAVARTIELADPIENMGVQMVRQVAARTSEVAGDGTTTATLLAAAIVREGMKYVAAGVNPMDLKRGIEKAAGAVVAALQAMARPCATREEIAQVAAIAANNDADLGALVAEAMERVGREGAITIEDGSGLRSELEVVEGIRFERGYLSPYFINTEEGQRAVLEDALILLSGRKLSTLAPLVPLLEAVVQSGKPLLVVAEDVEGEALAILVVNTLRGGLKACAVKAPEFGEKRAALLEDIAAVTGATVIAEETGLTLEHAGLAHLGRAKRVEVDRESCTLIGGGGEAARVEARLAAIKGELARATNAQERESLRLRAAKLAGGVAVVKVGGATEAEIKERRARVEDALHAARAAIAEGILPGGGVALLRAREALGGLHGTNHDEDCGIRILSVALDQPLRQIAENSGIEASVVLDRVSAATGNFGFNAATGDYGDLIAMGILDPCKVTRSALQNAVSVADLILTTACAVPTLRADCSAGPAPAERKAGGQCQKWIRSKRSSSLYRMSSRPRWARGSASPRRLARCTLVVLTTRAPSSSSMFMIRSMACSAASAAASWRISRRYSSPSSTPKSPPIRTTPAG